MLFSVFQISIISLGIAIGFVVINAQPNILRTDRSADAPLMVPQICELRGTPAQKRADIVKIHLTCSQIVNLGQAGETEVSRKTIDSLTDRLKGIQESTLMIGFLVDAKRRIG